MQRYLLNPPVKVAVWLGLGPGYVLLETTGARTGKRRRNVVGMNVAGTAGWLVSEQGRYAGYVNNLRAHPHVRVRRHARWRAARASVVTDDDVDARLASFSRVQAATVRRFGTDLMTVRVDFDAAR